MRIIALLLLGISTILVLNCATDTNKNLNYKDYHAEVIEAEELISQEKYEEALNHYDHLFNTYDFVFLRDYIIAAQIQLRYGDREKGVELVKKAILNGWSLKDVKNQFMIQRKLSEVEWQSLEDNYRRWYAQFSNRINDAVRTKVKTMIDNDQKLAYEISLIEDEQEQEIYILKHFSVQSEKHIKEMSDILNTYGYPGEYIIGNNYWGSMILSHHNSQELEYVQNDTLYDFIRPRLFESLEKGYISPYELALVEDWKNTVISEWSESPYGYLNPPNTNTIAKVNQNRAAIGLRSIELRNKLVDLGEKTGINFYLPDWIVGKIPIED